jgi:hypothetical protein
MKKLALNLALLSLLVSDLRAQQVRLVHNSADLSVNDLKIWVNDTVWINNLSFRNATAFQNFTLGTYTIGLSPLSATSQAQSILQQTVSFSSTIQEYLLIISGIASAGPSYSPGTTAKPLTIFSYTTGFIGMPPPMQAHVIYIQGCTDCQSLSITAPAHPSINNFSYGQFYYQTNVPAQTTTLTVNSGTVHIGDFTAPLQNYAGNEVTVLMSGFLNPAVNSNGPEFGLFALPPGAGTLIPLARAVDATFLNENIKNDVNIELGPNPASCELNVQITGTKFQTVDLEILDSFGKQALVLKEVPDKYTLNLEGLKTGLYFITVRTESNVKTVKFIKT